VQVSTVERRAPSKKGETIMSRTILVKPNKTAALANVRDLIAGTQKHTPNGQLTFGNATYTSQELVQLFQGLADAMAAHDVARAKAKDLLATLRDVAAKVNPVLRAYRRFVIATYGNAVQTLADYGIEPPKAKVPLTSEQKATAAAKVLATRKARGTKSKKQQAKIHGVAPAAAADSSATHPSPTTGSKPAGT
jgi:hypothetical protein